MNFQKGFKQPLTGTDGDIEFQCKMFLFQQDGDMADVVLLISMIFNIQYSNIQYSIMIFDYIQWISMQNTFLLAGQDGDMAGGLLLISMMFNI